ncbi:MAG: fumarate hydratase C-terminal domain-containing protein [Gammaproteobacteria bacterium]|nr:fumarate hydratase C-terminal domain-containing protein [Gammaproteobacteria bacterium]MDX2458877.1 fumarate hydratase C-terminal domain-containing protein [Gammaproteobacteria bacterium]
MADKQQQPQQVRLKIPASAEDLKGLQPGTVVFLDGVIYTGREGVYKKVIDEGVPLPLDLPAISNANFHCSPAAAQEPDGSFNVGGVTATASFRFSKWMPQWFEKSGAKIIIGKGGMSAADYAGMFVPAGAVYLTTVGYGTGALLGRGVKKVRDVFWLDELGIAQAMWVFEVENFGPFLVDSDLAGNSLFEQHTREINAGLAKVYAGLGPPALGRFGETDDRKDELV